MTFDYYDVIASLAAAIVAIIITTLGVFAAQKTN